MGQSYMVMKTSSNEKKTQAIIMLALTDSIKLHRMENNV